MSLINYITKLIDLSREIFVENELACKQAVVA
jgi:hypothetical protein